MTFWNQPTNLKFLPCPTHNQKLLPVVRKNGARAANLQVVHEFKAKLKLVEDLVTKLAFNLREIQDMWSQPLKNQRKSDLADNGVVMLFSNPPSAHGKH